MRPFFLYQRSHEFVIIYEGEGGLVVAGFSCMNPLAITSYASFYYWVTGGVGINGVGG